MNNNKNSIFTTGLKEDCENLIRNIMEYKSYEFKYFCTEWARMNFNYIFLNKPTDPVMVKFVEEALIIIKLLFLKSHNELEKVHYFYLLYAVYFKQPLKEFCKIRVVFDEWQVFLSFLNSVENNGSCIQFKIIFWKLLVADAFRFVECVAEQGLDPYMHRDNTDKFESNLIQYIGEEVEGLQKNDESIMKALSILEPQYNVHKQALNDSKGTHIVEPTSIVDKLNESLTRILKLTNPKLFTSATSDNNMSLNLDQEADAKKESAKSDIGDRRKSLKNRALGVATTNKAVIDPINTSSSSDSSYVSNINKKRLKNKKPKTKPKRKKKPVSTDESTSEESYMPSTSKRPVLRYAKCRDRGFAEAEIAADEVLESATLDTDKE